MKNHFAFIILLAALFVTCSKDPEIKENKFVPGDLIVGIKADADLKTVLDVFNQLNFEIKQMQGFYYSINLPADSLAPLLNYLNSKPYINIPDAWKAYAFYVPSEKVIKICSGFFNMSKIAQYDLLNTIQQKHWIDRHEDYKYIFLKIPVGTERYWENELLKYPFIKWSELNVLSSVSID